MIRHLLWVCGPCGAGKTSFISQLVAGDLSQHIVAQLPAGAANWLQLKAKNLLCSRARLPPRLIVHYSLTRHQQSSNPRNDPHLQFFELAEAITVVHLKPSKERVALQLSHRQRQNRELKGNYSSVGKALRAAMSSRLSRSSRRLALLLAVRSQSAVWDPKEEEAREARMSGNYRGGIELLYVRWEDYIQWAICNGCSIKEIFLRPDPNSIPGDVK